MELSLFRSSVMRYYSPEQTQNADKSFDPEEQRKKYTQKGTGKSWAVPTAWANEIHFVIPSHFKRSCRAGQSTAGLKGLQQIESYSRRCHRAFPALLLRGRTGS